MSVADFSAYKTLYINIHLLSNLYFMRILGAHLSPFRDSEDCLVRRVLTCVRGNLCLVYQDPLLGTQS
jgi:hypothetical protein